MRKLLPLLLIGLCAGDAGAGKFEPFAGPKPMAVLIERDPWAGVIGGDTPRTAVYQDGVVVTYDEKAGDYVTKTLSPAELGALKAKLSALGDTKTIKDHYDTLGPTDQATTVLFLDLDGTPHRSSVYALAHASFEDRTDGPSLKLIKSARDLLAGLSYPDAKPWKPVRVEVMLWPFENAKGKAIPWPKDWPGLHSPVAINRHGDSYSIFLASAKIGELSKLSAKLGEKNSALALDGKRWAMSYRPVFPSEPVWR